MDETEFRPRYDDVMQAINQRGFRRALEPAYCLAVESDRAEAWFQYNLAVCLTGLCGGATEGSPGLIDKIKECRDHTPHVEGDARRDRANALVTGRPRKRDLWAADMEIVEVKRLHEGDENRMLVLRGTKGRLAYARKQYALANDTHYLADKGWRELGELADQQWVYNNLIHWLKAVVKQCGRTSDHAAMLRRRIREECPEGAKNRSDEADRICRPVIGNFVDDLARAYQHRLPNWLHRRLHR